MKRETIFFTGSMLYIFLFLAALQLFAGGKQQHPIVEGFNDRSCVDCHMEVTPEITEAWKSSKHGMMNFGCYMCHGDGIEAFKPQPTGEMCMGCHSGKQTDMVKIKARSCFDCHSGHTLKFHSSVNE